MKSDEPTTPAGIAGDRQVKRKSSDPCSEKSGIDEVKLRDGTAHVESASKRSDAKMEDMMKRMEAIMKQTSETVLRSVKTQINGINSTINEMKVEGESKLGKMDERFAGLEARLNRLEDTSNRTNAMNVNVDELHRMQDDQNGRRAVATGCRDDTTENKVETLLRSTIGEAGMSRERIQIKCPAKPTTHAFLRFTDSEERDKYIRSAKQQKIQLSERKIRISPAVDAKRMGLIKLCLDKKA